jgi:hypothetical protein
MPISVDGTNGITFNDATAFNTASSLGMRNRIINGDMRIWQRATSFSPTGNLGSYYTTDRFYLETTNSTAVSTWARSTDAPPGFTYSMLQTVTTTQSSIASTGQYYGFCQCIEGYNFADFAYGTSSAKTGTLSFWVKSSVTGTFCAGLCQSDVSVIYQRTYPFTYTITSANTWTFITITFPGDTVSNNNNVTNGCGLRIEFYSMLSAGYANGTVNQWNPNLTGTQYASSTGVNLFATSGATWQITGIQVEIGTLSTTFERRHYGAELSLCHRYYVQYNASSGTSQLAPVPVIMSNTGASIAMATLITPVPMRATPSLTIGSGNINYAFIGTIGSGLTSTSTTITVQNYFGNMLLFNLTGFTSTDGYTGTLSIRNTLTVSAEL